MSHCPHVILYYVICLDASFVQYLMVAKAWRRFAAIETLLWCMFLLHPTVGLAWACRYLSSLGSILYSSPCPPVPVSYPSSLYSEGRTAYNSPSPPQSSSIWPTCMWSCHRPASYHFPGP